MPTPTYVALAKTVLTSTQADITFSAIPSTYTDLIVLVSARANFAAYQSSLFVTVNGSSAANYSITRLWTNVATTSSSRNSNSTFLNVHPLNLNSTTSNTFSSHEIYFPNYAGSINKVLSATGVGESNNASSGHTNITATAGLRQVTDAITSIKITSGDGSFMADSRFDLYGIKNS
jgi:hypothetical protein